MNILLDNQSERPNNTGSEVKKENVIRPNLFQGNTDSEIGAAKFPEWDIVPPTQFINPRVNLK